MPGQADHPDFDTAEEQRAGGTCRVGTEHRERMGERMAAAVVGQDACHADDNNGKYGDEPQNDDHDAIPVEEAGSGSAGTRLGVRSPLSQSHL